MNTGVVPKPSTGASRHLTRPVIAGVMCTFIAIVTMILVVMNAAAWLNLAVDELAGGYSDDVAQHPQLVQSQHHHATMIWLVLTLAPAVAAVVWTIARRRRVATALAITSVVLLLPGLAYYGIRAQWSDQPAPQPADTATHCVTYSGTISTCPGG